jgi:hypothetical protein
VDAEPDTALAPDQRPEALQEVALAELQVSVAPDPLATVVGFALSVTLGAGCVTVTFAVCAPVPPAPVQVNV